MIWDITRSVLTQIIFEQENKEGAQNLLPIKFLRQLIGFYGGAMQKFVPSYLEVSLESFTREQEKFRQQISQAFGATPFGPIMEEQVRRNMEMFKQAFSMFTPFARHDEQGGEAEKTAATAASSGSDLEELRKQLDDMRKKVDKLSDGEK
jgi:polyhydroxyalkanoate synthesis regulator protein